MYGYLLIKKKGEDPAFTGPLSLCTCYELECLSFGPLLGLNDGLGLGGIPAKPGRPGLVEPAVLGVPCKMYGEMSAHPMCDGDVIFWHSVSPKSGAQHNAGPRSLDVLDLVPQFDVFSIDLV